MTLRKVVCVSFVVALQFLFSALDLGAIDSTKFESRATPFLTKYCLDCHDDETQKGDVAFHELNAVVHRQEWTFGGACRHSKIRIATF